jgi:hypothetical protein
MASLGHLNAAGDVLGFQSFGIVRLADVASCLPVQTAGLAAQVASVPRAESGIGVPARHQPVGVIMTEVVGRVRLEKDYPVYDIGDPAFSFYVIDKNQVALADEHGPVRTLRGPASMSANGNCRRT